MKKTILLAFLALITLPVFGGVKMVFGSFAELARQRAIPVYLNWDSVVYGRMGNLDDFLAKSYRHVDWESRSLSYFLQAVNSKVGEYGVSLAPASAKLETGNNAPAMNISMPETSNSSDNNTKYRIVIATQTITKGGKIEGELQLYSENATTPVAVASFTSDDSDDNDQVAFRDQFRSIGKSFAKLLEKQLKDQFE